MLLIYPVIYSWRTPSSIALLFVFPPQGRVGPNQDPDVSNSSEFGSHPHILKAKTKQENYRDRRAYTRELLRSKVELFAHRDIMYSLLMTQNQQYTHKRESGHATPYLENKLSRKLTRNSVEGDTHQNNYLGVFINNLNCSYHPEALLNTAHTRHINRQHGHIYPSLVTSTDFPVHLHEQ